MVILWESNGSQWQQKEMQIESRDGFVCPDHAYLTVSPTPTVFGYRFYDSVTKIVEVEGEIFTRYDHADKTGWFYPNGKIHTAETFRRLPRKIKKTLNPHVFDGYHQVVLTRTGRWEDFREGEDQIV